MVWKITEVPLSSGIAVGGERGMPFLSYEGLGRRQLVAGEVIDDPEVVHSAAELLLIRQRPGSASVVQI